MMEFSQRLFALRRQTGLSQEELANLLGVTRQAVQKWETGASRPDMDNLTALADYFQVSLDYLIRGDAAPEQGPAVHHYYSAYRYEYKSRRTLFGLPLVHVNFGFGFTRAKGIIAVGNVATGLVALGGLSVGLLSLGGVSLGLLLALGGVALGCVSAGGLAIGLMAWGGFAVGLLAVGGVAAGMYAAGGVAVGSKVAVGGAASAPLAIGAAAKGAQAFVEPAGGFSEGELAAIQSAIETACQGAPRWVAGLLGFFAWYGV